MSSQNFTESKVICEDQFVLAATTYTPTNEIKGAIIIGPATGIKRQVYANFASFLAENGYGVITFDNRGIGGSLVGNIKSSKKISPPYLNSLKLLSLILSII